MIVVPLEINVRIQWDSSRRGKKPKERLRRAIRDAYSQQDSRVSMRDSIFVEEDNENHPDEAGDSYVATLRTEKLAGWSNLVDVRDSVTRAVENEFNHSIVGARITISDEDGNSTSFGW